jgi:hypothetical protein
MYIVLAVLSAITIWLFFMRSTTSTESNITAEAKKGRFDVVITVTGELRAKTQTDIMAPMGLRNAGIYQIKINDLVPEGTVVDEGEYVATLDKTEVMNKLNEELLNVQKKESEFNQTQLDTAIQLREARDEVDNYKFELEQKKLELEQSAFEAPAIKDQVTNAYKKAERTLKQKIETLDNKVAQARAKMNIVLSDLTKAQNRLKVFQDLLGELTINAPKDGMIIYAKEWSGRKRVVGSTINVWDPDVANLPDLTEMQVISYVNEVDIQKVQAGQNVAIGLDADPSKKLSGKVKTVASIGEQRPNQNSKVFEVVIDVLTKDSTLRPSMTTSCNIQYSSFDDAITVPVEAVNVLGDKSFVYKKDGGSIVRQQVLVEATNSKDAYVKHGLEVGQKVYLKDITDTANIKWVLLPKELLQPKDANKAKDKTAAKDSGAKKEAVLDENEDEEGGN